MRWALAFALLVAGCSKGPGADLQSIKQARSIAAEWALVNEAASQGKLTDTYAASMRLWLHGQLEAASGALTQQNAPYAAEIRSLLQQPANASPQTLRAHCDKLKTIEDALESA